MKAIIFILSLLLSVACNNDDIDIKQDENKILGNWKLVQVFYSDGDSEPSWHDVQNGYTIKINSNGIFESNRFLDCENGNYILNTNNEIQFNYNCPNFPNSYLEVIENLTDSQLILKPTYMNCDEGCSYKFIKQ